MQGVARLERNAELRMVGYWRKFFTEQLHYSKFCFSHKDWKAFTFSPVSIGCTIQKLFHNVYT